MNASLQHRMAVIAGLALAAAMAVWWLGSARLALDQGKDAAVSAADMLGALLLVRGMALAVLSVRVAALLGWRAAVAAGLGLIVPSWPLVLVAWSASAMPLSRVVQGETLLLAASVALPLIGLRVRRWLREPQLAVMSGTAVGVALATALLLTRAAWS